MDPRLNKVSGKSSLAIAGEESPVDRPERTQAGRYAVISQLSAWKGKGKKYKSYNMIEIGYFQWGTHQSTNSDWWLDETVLFLW